MNDLKHTPAPWGIGWGVNGLTGPTTAVDDPFCGGDKVEYTPIYKGMDTVAIVPQQTDGTFLANAKLIAAAPELLDCLMELVDLMQGVIDGEYTPDSFTLQPARNAINKAPL